MFFFQIRKRQINNPLGLASYMALPTKIIPTYTTLLQKLSKECAKKEIKIEVLDDAIDMLTNCIEECNNLLILKNICNCRVSILVILNTFRNLSY